MSGACSSVDEVFAAYQPGVDILQGMSLTVPQGGFVLVIGPNGAGKSTLLKTVFGLLGAHRGAHRARRPGDRQPARRTRSSGWA